MKQPYCPDFEESKLPAWLRYCLYAGFTGVLVLIVYNILIIGG